MTRHPTFFRARCPRGHAIEIHRHPMSSGGGPHRRRQEKSHRLNGFGWILCEFWWWWLVCGQVRWAHGDRDEETVLGCVDSLRLVQLRRLRRNCTNLRESTPAGYSDPKSWDPEDKDEMDEIFYGSGYGTDLVMCTSGLWLYFILIPT